jgi:hypothetical protein
MMSTKIGTDFLMIYESDFNYDMGNMDSIEYPYNGYRISKIYDSGNCSENVFFDVPFEKKYLDFLGDAKYVTFDVEIHPCKDFYAYLETCNHYHVGFDIRNSIKTNEIKLSDNIKSILIGDYYSSIKINSNVLEKMYIGDYETNNLYPNDLMSNIPKTVKMLMINGYCMDPIFNPIEVLVLGGIMSGTTIPGNKNSLQSCPKCHHCEKIKNQPDDYYPQTLKELIIVPEIDCEDEFIVNIPLKYKNIAKIYIPDGFKCECQINWC